MESLNIHNQFSYTATGSILKGFCMHDNQRQAHWIYAAAIMDSDGCFMIARYMRKYRYDYLPTVKIAMIQDGSVNYIKESTGLGTISINGTRPSRPNSKPLYQWSITNRSDLIEFLNGIMPYLKNKKDRAEHLLDYCLMIGLKPIGQRHIRLSDDELHYREEAYQKMRKLNGNNAAATTKS